MPRLNLPTLAASMIAFTLSAQSARAQLITPNTGGTKITALPEYAFYGEGGGQSAGSDASKPDNPLAQFFLRGVPNKRMEYYVVGNIGAGLSRDNGEFNTAGLVTRSAANTGFLLHAEFATESPKAPRLYGEYAYQGYTVAGSAPDTDKHFNTATWDGGIRLPLSATGTGEDTKFRVSVTGHYQYVQIAGDATSKANFRSIVGTGPGEKFKGYGAQVVVQLNDFSFEFGWVSSSGLNTDGSDQGVYVLRASAMGKLIDFKKRD